ncbi:MAG: hypothetical protein IJT97_02460 [Bacteroidaceae bacterium]|nr:hypothetical protein [Bacteroidaceae bacterium]
MLRFRIKISVEGLQYTDAQAVLNSFIQSVKAKYELGICEETNSGSLSDQQAATHAEAILTVPFSERESVRIDYNIFAAQFEDEHPEDSDVYFRMESA